MNKHLDKEAKRIADAIVELVERTDGPVTFTQIEREIPGFAAKGRRVWQYTIGETPEKPALVVWGDMTEPGVMALKRVMGERRVAVQYVTPVLYLDCLLEHENWAPMVLLPARAANLDTLRWLMRAPETYLEHVPTIPHLKECYRFLTPGPVGSTADQFSPPL